jgi:hypothetical protein
MDRTATTNQPRYHHRGPTTLDGSSLEIRHATEVDGTGIGTTGNGTIINYNYAICHRTETESKHDGKQTY